MRPKLGGACISTVQYQKTPLKTEQKVIQSLSAGSIAGQPAISLSSDSLSLRCKHTATEHALNNADPLVAKKNACQATSIAVGRTPALNKRVSILWLLKAQVLT